MRLFTPRKITFGLLLAMIISATTGSFTALSASMAPALISGDYFYINKAAYGYGPYSFGLPLPISKERIFAAEPARGDVVLFRHPAQPNINYIKRVVGLPGDWIEMREGRLYINDIVVERRQVAPMPLAAHDKTIIDAATYEESLPGGATYLIAEIEGDQGVNDNIGPVEVPTGHYFVLGDNRDNSTDSRIDIEMGGVGFVPFENLIGKATFIYFSKPEEGGVSLARIGKVIR